MKFSPHGKREIWTVAVVTLALGAISLKYLPYALPVPLLLFLFTLYFFRDPNRDIPNDKNIMVSPADGTVTDIKTVSCPELEGIECLRIGIFLSVFDVHVNRSPASGEVTDIIYTEGAFHNAMSEKASSKNESNMILFDRNGLEFGVKQIAGLIARRIRCDVTEEMSVERGERIGMIKFGSRTEIYIPLSHGPEPVVEEEDGVRGGESILAKLSPAENQTRTDDSREREQQTTAES